MSGREQSKPKPPAESVLEDDAVIISEEEGEVFLAPGTFQKEKGQGLVARDQSNGVVLTMDACFKSFDKDE